MDAGEIVASEGLVLTHWRNVFVNVWTGEATVERFRALRRMREDLRRAYPRGVATITVLDGEIVRLSPEARDEAASLARDYDAVSLGVAHVLEGTGFGAAARRMMLSGVLAFDRRRVPTKTFDSAHGAAGWVAERVATAGERAWYAQSVAAHVAAARRARR